MRPICGLDSSLGSGAVARAVGGAGTGGATLQLVHRSTYPGSWPQPTGAIADPHHGAEMLRCGEEKGAFAAAAASGGM